MNGGRFEMTFVRGITDAMLDHLRALARQPSWWHDILKRPDDLFIAIRNNYINVYNNGRNVLLCEFPRGHFQLGTHHKYLGVSKPGTRANVYLEGERELTVRGTNNPAFSIDEILNKVSTYSKTTQDNEKLHLHSVLNRNVNVIDVEMAFIALPKEVPDPQKKEPRTDRMDFVSVSRKGLQYPTLVFYEAKEANNSALKARDEPKIMEQLERYRNQLRKRSDEIIRAYLKLIAQTAEIERMRSNKSTRNSRIAWLDGIVKAGKLEIDPVPRLLIFEGGAYAGGNWEQHLERLKRLYFERFGVHGITIGKDEVDLPA
jgi:hypothetical protein